jgi:DNA-binding response OmpR family regulator
LFLTANDNEDMLVKGLESGGDDYMTKPFSIKELYARISSLLRRVNTNNSIVRIGDLTIDLNRYEIKKNNELISLSQIDYEIFFMFIKNKNQVLTRNQLLETLEKNGSYDIEDNTLSVHIKRIREKIGLYNNKSYIETLRGIGYRINQEVLNGNK